MSETTHPIPSFEELTENFHMEKSPGYDAWFRQQVRLALKDKADGARYTDFRQVAAQFGYDAR